MPSAVGTLQIRREAVILRAVEVMERNGKRRDTYRVEPKGRQRQREREREENKEQDRENGGELTEMSFES